MNNIKISSINLDKEITHIKKSENIKGVILYLPELFRVAKSNSKINEFINGLEELSIEEERKEYELFEKGVSWIHDKFHKILILIEKNELSHHEFIQKEIHDALKFIPVISSHGYIGHLQDILLFATSNIVQYKQCHSDIVNWCEITTVTNGDFAVEKIIYPNFINIKYEPFEKKIYDWKANISVSLLAIYRFLKILLLFPAKTLKRDVPQNINELYQYLTQWDIHAHLKKFESLDINNHLISQSELVHILERFVFFIEKQIQENDLVISQKEKKHGKTKQYEEDYAALEPFAIRSWTFFINSNSYLIKIGQKKVASHIIENLPRGISLHTNKPLSVAKAVAKNSDPRIYENGKCVGLKPHWDSPKK